MNGSGGHVDTILNLLKDKNYHLQKFFQMNETEMVKFDDDNFDNLEVFYQSRETILDLIRCIDDLISEAAHADDGAVATDLQRAEMVRLMAQKKEIVHKILNQDLQILSVIGQAKSDVIREPALGADRAQSGQRLPRAGLGAETRRRGLKQSISSPRPAHFETNRLIRSS